jgi:hypothetical protein
MRTLAIFLLLANLALAGYLLLEGGAGGEPARLKEQVQPDKIRILTPQEVAALGPAKAATLADVCLDWGPFGETDRARAQAEVDALGIAKLVTLRRVETQATHWVFLPPYATRQAADKRVAELKAAGVKDAVVVDGGPQRFAIALGAHRTEEAASAQVAELAKQGVTGARAGPRPQVVVQTVLVVRDPQQQVIARLRDLLPGYPGAEVKIGGCEKPA